MTYDTGFVYDHSSYWSNRKYMTKLENEIEMLSKENKKLKDALTGDIVLIKKNTFNTRTWECEYIDKYYFNDQEKSVVVKYIDKLDDPEDVYTKICMEEAGLLISDDMREGLKKKPV